ncbi:MAG: hypothetical protein RL760_1292, partial [Candidatus Eisenbacteria bacterium]
MSSTSRRVSLLVVWALCVGAAVAVAAPAGPQPVVTPFTTAQLEAARAVRERALED